MTVPAAVAPQARLAQLDSMRGLAAMVVMLGHLHQLLVTEGPHTLAWRLADALPKRALGSAAAVDFFFVLSGFVLARPYVTPATLARPARPLALDVFYLRRFLRIMPTYWAGMAVALVLRAVTRPFWDALPFHLHMRWDVPLTRHDLVQAFVLVGGLDPLLINGPVWSLAVEMQMSLLLPLLIAAFAQRPRLHEGILLLAVLVLAPFFGGSSAGGACIRFLPLFGVGVFAAYLGHATTPRFRAVSRLAFRALLLGAVLLIWNRSWTPRWDFPDMRRDLLTAAGSALVILLAVARAESFTWLERRAALYLGDISYSLYLIHLPIVLATMAFLLSRGVPPAVAAAVAAGLAMLGAIALHHGVERPSLGWIRQVPRLLPRREERAG